MRALTSSIALLTIISCTNVQSQVITAEGLDYIGEQFVAISNEFNRLAKDQKVSEEDYMKWRLFGMKFQAAYPAAIHMWRIAVMTNDKVLEGKVIDSIAVMLPELVAFGKEVSINVEVFKQ